MANGGGCGVNTIVMFARARERGSNKALSGSGSGYFPHSAGGYIVREEQVRESARQRRKETDERGGGGVLICMVPAHEPTHTKPGSSMSRPGESLSSSFTSPTRRYVKQ